LGSAECAKQRLEEIIAGANDNGALALVRSFEDAELYSLWGDHSGRTSSSRLEWLLEATSDSWWKPTHFALNFGNDCDFREEFRDSQFDTVWYLDEADGKSNQVGHFLTAVHIVYKQWAIGFLIGHEKFEGGKQRGDWWLADNINDWSYMLLTTQDHTMFYDAVEYDEQALYDKRDELLWTLLDFDAEVDFENVSANRDGNSLQDFRLSLKGYRFAKWVRENGSSHPSFAASWLRVNLMSLPTMPRPSR
jgi:hypothetical protein